MKRKLLSILLALCMVICLMPQGMVADAATKGWTQQDGKWVWLDSNGDKVTNEFKLSGSNYYWLNKDGFLGSDELVEYNDNYYYVDETGAMIRNDWREVENKDNDNNFGKTVWYYFQSSGKAYKSGKKTINGTSYIFDDKGRRLYGWISKSEDGLYTMGSKDDNSVEWKTCDYYAGEESDGAVVTNAWRTIKVYDGTPACNYKFYFGSNGKKYKLTDSDKENGYTTTEKTINDEKYKFADDGHLVDGQAEETGGESTGKTTCKKGWYYNKDTQKKYYYRDTNGGTYSNQIATINGKKYLFDENGSILVGLYYLEFNSEDKEKTIKKMTLLDGENDGTNFATYTTLNDTTYNASESTSKSGVYYFKGPVDTGGEMVTGSTTVEIDGANYSFKFATSGNKGKGLTGRDGSYYYVNGRKVKANSNNNFELFKRTPNNGDITKLSGGGNTAAKIVADKTSDETPTQEIPYALISSSGTIVKSGTKKAGDYKITVQDYRVTKIADSIGTTVWESTIPSDAMAGSDGDTSTGEIVRTFTYGTKINPSILFGSGISASTTTYLFGYDINTPIDWPSATTTLNVGTYYAWAITDNSTDENPWAESTTVATSFNVTGTDIDDSKITATDVVTTYTGSEQKIEIDVNTNDIADMTGKKVTYSLTEDGIYSDSLKFTDATDGAQTVYYKITSDNYNEYIGTATVTVKPMEAQLNWDKSASVNCTETENIVATIENAKGDDDFNIKYNRTFDSAGSNITVTVTSLGNSNYTLPADAAGKQKVVSVTHTGTLGGWHTSSTQHWKEYSCCKTKAEIANHTDANSDIRCDICNRLLVTYSSNSSAVTNRTETTAAGEKKVTNADISAKISADADENKTASVRVDAATAEEIVEKAVENKSETVVINGVNKEAAAPAAIEIAIPAVTVTQLSEKTDAGIAIKTNDANIMLDKQAVAAVAGKVSGTAGDVKITVKKVGEDSSNLKLEVKIETANGEVKDFKGGSMTVTVKLSDELADKELVCVNIDDKGIYHRVKGQKNADKTFTFTYEK